jgi:DNA adenine methylase
MPRSFKAYFEPFIGAASVYLEVWNRGFRGPAFLGDYNPEIVNIHMAVKSSPSWFLREYAVHAAKDSKAYFEALRDADASGWTPARRAARTVYLAKAGYCGLLRTRPDGRFSAHYGDGKPGRARLDAAKVLIAAKALWSATICHADFEWIGPLARKGDLVFLDPPYFGTNDRFTANGFGTDDQRRLAGFCRGLDERGVLFLQTNSDCGFVRELYGRFRLVAVPPRPSFCCDGTSRQPVGEVIIANYEPKAKAAA